MHSDVQDKNPRSKLPPIHAAGCPQGSLAYGADLARRYFDNDIEFVASRATLGCFTRHEMDALVQTMGAGPSPTSKQKTDKD